MTYKVWERRLKQELKVLSKDERARVVEYYREMHDEMASYGRTDDSIIKELGSPESCARRTLAESGYSVAQNNNGSSARKSGHSAAEIIGLIFFTALLLLPLAVVLFALVASLGAICIGGAAAGIGGIGYAIGYPILSGGGSAAIAGAGMGLAASGAGLLLFVGFFFATKYAAIGSIKLFKVIYTRW